MPDKLTDKEIVKALECHTGKIGKRCQVCPYTIYGCYCLDHLHPDLLDLINRLQADKQNLEIELQSMRGAANSYKAENKRLSTLAKLGNMRANDYRVMRDRALKAEAENERMKNNVSSMAITLSNSAKATRHEAYKEFAERLKEKEVVLYDDSPYGDYYDSYSAVYISEIDNLLKELVGEKNES